MTDPAASGGPPTPPPTPPAAVAGASTAAPRPAAAGVAVGPSPARTVSTGNEAVPTEHWYVPQLFMHMTESDLRRALHEHQEALESRRGWEAPLGIAIGIAVALLSGVHSSSVAYFLLVLFLGVSLLWLGHATYQWFKHRTHGGIDEIVECFRPKR